MTRLRQAAPLALLLCLLSPSVLALQVTPGSDCAAYCLDDTNGSSFDPDDSNTNSTDIVCNDNDFSGESKGIKFKNCQECLQKSEHVNGTESDMHWFMYNLRYTISTCLFGNPNQIKDHVNSPCIIDYACLPIEKALATGLNSTDEEKTWSYCDETEGRFTVEKLENCVKCLNSSPDQSYLGNFVVALGAGCDQRPEPGSSVSLTDTIFSSSPINGTEPEEDIRSRPAGASSSTLTTGAIVGIAVGAGLLLFGGLALFCVYWRKQKKYEATEKPGGDFFGAGGSGGVDGGGGGGGAYTPDPLLPPQGAQMTSSLRHMSGDGSGFGAPPGHMKGMSVSSAEYYDKLEQDNQHTNYNFDPRSTNRGPNGALPSHPAYVPRAASRQSRLTPPPGPESQTRSSSNNSNVHPPIPPQTGDSYAMHKYSTSASSQRAANSTRSTPKSSPNNLPPPPPPPGPPPSHKPKVPSLVLPSVGRVRGPKKYSPPLVNRSGTPSSMEREREEHLQAQAERPPTAMHISQPVMANDERFQDTPLKGGTVVSTDAAAGERHQRNTQWNEVPMKSGKTALYGY